MGTFSVWHILLLALVVLVLFGGRGKISELMGDFAKGIKSFRKGLADDDHSRAQIPEDRRDPPPVNKDTAPHS